MIGKAGEKKLYRAARRGFPFFLGLLVLIGPSPLLAVPVEVTLYPDSARITEMVHAKLPSSAGSLASANFTLPGSADPATLTIGCLPAGSCRVEDYQVKRIETPLGPKEAEIEKKAAKLRDEDARIRAAILATESQIQFWQLQTKAKQRPLPTPRTRPLPSAGTSARPDRRKSPSRKPWQDRAAPPRSRGGKGRPAGPPQIYMADHGIPLRDCGP